MNVTFKTFLSYIFNYLAFRKGWVTSSIFSKFTSSKKYQSQRDQKYPNCSFARKWVQWPIYGSKIQSKSKSKKTAHQNSFLNASNFNLFLNRLKLHSIANSYQSKSEVVHSFIPWLYR